MKLNFPIDLAYEIIFIDPSKLISLGIYNILEFWSFGHMRKYPRRAPAEAAPVALARRRRADGRCAALGPAGAEIKHSYRSGSIKLFAKLL